MLKSHSYTDHQKQQRFVSLSKTLNSSRIKPPTLLLEDDFLNHLTTTATHWWFQLNKKLTLVTHNPLIKYIALLMLNKRYF